MADQRLLTIREASEKLGFRESTLRKWVFQKRITYCKLGRAVRLPAAVIETMIQESYQKPVEGEAGSYLKPASNAR
jgi:excisionase family DNA binding protein